MNKKEYTEFILAKYPESRSDDDVLIYYHLRRFHYFDNPTPKALQEITSQTVSLYDLVRYRQKFQRENKYLGTPEVMERRRKNGEKRRQQEREKTVEVIKTQQEVWGVDSMGNREFMGYETVAL